MSKYHIAVLPGDGVGNDVMEAAKIILDSINLDAEYINGDIGWEFWKNEGNPLPDRTVNLLKEADCALFGAITSKPNEDAQKELIIDQQKYFAFSIDNVDNAQTKPKLMDGAMRKASHAMGQVIDAFLAAKYTEAGITGTATTIGISGTSLSVSLWAGSGYSKICKWRCRFCHSPRACISSEDLRQKK